MKKNHVEILGVKADDLANAGCNKGDYPPKGITTNQDRVKERRTK